MTDYKLVPVEPTEAMIDAARDIHEGERYLPVILYTDIYKAMLAAAPAVQRELVGWQFYKHGKWWNGDILTKNQRKNIEKEGVRVRNVYAEPQFAEQQPAPDVSGLVEALEGIMRVEARDRIMPVGAEWDAARAALAAYRKGGE